MTTENLTAEAGAPRSGIDTDALDPATRPQDDLYRHVNGRWLSTYEIPADRARDGAFRTLADRAEEQVRDIITGAADGDPSGTLAKVGAMYASFMDVETIDALGAAPLEPDLALIRSATSQEELTGSLGALQRTGAAGAVGFYVDNDAHDPERYVVYLYQGGLGLPDESYYREEHFAEIRAAYTAHIARMLTLAGVVAEDAATAAAGRVMALETKLAGHHWDVVRDRDANLTYNPTTLAELASSAPGFDWNAWSVALRVPEAAFTQIVVREPSYTQGFAELWTTEPLEDWKLWMAYHAVSARAPYLHSELVEANFDFYGRTLTGAQEIRDRWKRGVALVEGALGEAVGQEYVGRHFPAGHKAKMEELVANLIEAYRESITGLDWMGEDTKVKALAKLDAFVPKIGYPVKWRDYSALEVQADDLLGNVRRSNSFDLDHELNKVGKPIDRDEWYMTPQTVNAYYNPGMNEIVFPAAILQPPFFDPEAEDAVNYGGIGSVIGHEIGHGFDDQGSKYDGAGRLEDWWTEQDRAEFEKRTAALIDQYDAFTPLGLDSEHKVNGALTIGENIGDLGGLSIALKAYRIALGTDLDDAPVVDGLTGVQRVLLGWAQVWRTKAREAEAIRLLAIDPHSPAEFRCNGVVRNLDEFYAAYDVQPGDALYLEPAERVRIW
ncbi:putative zinc metalloprotease [Flavimobilis marinus]|uniref:Endothelin-converting enzyme Metallo peptidase. MEROPS family M13 n=1 Tax=Flavimobilis marinus TaxID=285351 RepID=A0A1I2DXH1_9MICO|nr:M13 family metallopeptidase [Flavimobilis marinus]GHG44051.1 putative zinc metalloprotease [Flavimobilis marinus]SFE85392.1 endothelin-converting enzyme Metallo peptidase. MEROPS family M13 [Flavimobilis marinus]